MVKLPVELLPGEKVIDTWILLYRPPGGEKCNGICTVTNERIFCDTDEDLTPTGIDQYHSGAGKCLVIPKNRIYQVDTIRTPLEKRVILTLENGQEHEFYYGTLNIDRIVEAMTTR